MNLSIRKAEVRDVDLICALGITTFYEAYFLQDESYNLAGYLMENFSRTQISRELTDKNSAFYIAEMNEKAVGYAKLRDNDTPTFLEKARGIELQRLYVLEKFKSRKIGYALINHCLQNARAQGFAIIWLGVWERNLAAQKFYRKIGFEKCGELRFSYGDSIETNFAMKLKL